MDGIKVYRLAITAPKVTVDNGSAAAPSCVVGQDGNGFYRYNSNNIGLSIGGALKWLIGAIFQSGSSTGPYMNVVGSATQPAYGFVGAALTGMTVVATDDLRLIASAQSVLRARNPTGVANQGIVDVLGYSLKIYTSSPPASAADTGEAGEIRWDTDYVYVCVAANTWKRAALSTW
jgi:hypothetical protein